MGAGTVTSLTPHVTSTASRTLLGDDDFRYGFTGPRGSLAEPRDLAPERDLSLPFGGYAPSGSRRSVAVLLLAAVRGYECLRIPLGLGESAGRVLRAGAGLALGCVGVATVTDAQSGVGPVLLAAAMVTTASLAPRVGADLWSRRDRVGVGVGAGQRRRVVVAGRHPEQVARVVAELRLHPQRPFDVASVCLVRPARRTVFDVPVSVGFSTLPAHVAQMGASALIVLPCHHIDDLTLRRLGWQLERSRADLYVGTPLLDVAPARTSLAQAGGLRLLHVRTGNHDGPGRLVKDLLERLTAVVLLVLLLPVMLLVAVAVRGDSHGPAIYRQPRIGRGGTHFMMYKFRTMSADADRVLADLRQHSTADGVLFKMRQDPRVTRLGAFLRRYSVDELPQLVNIVLGDMSLVGPRPGLPTEAARYTPDARRRLAVKPGLTGLWQVSGRSDLSWEETVRLDLRYVDNWSLWLDLLIICRTARAVLNHRGAY